MIGIIHSISQRPTNIVRSNYKRGMSSIDKQGRQYSGCVIEFSFNFGRYVYYEIIHEELKLQNTQLAANLSQCNRCPFGCLVILPPKSIKLNYHQ